MLKLINKMYLTQQRMSSASLNSFRTRIEFESKIADPILLYVKFLPGREDFEEVYPQMAQMFADRKKKK